MIRKKIYKIPVVEKSFVLDSKYPVTEKEERIEEIEKISREAYQMGWDEAMNKNQVDTELLYRSMDNAIENIKKERDNIWIKCESEIIKLVFTIVKKIVYKEVSQSNSKIIENIVYEAISKVKENKILSIHVNPDDVKIMEAIKASGSHEIRAVYELISNDNITRGGCKVVTDGGGVDALVETRLNQIISAFKELDPESEGMGDV